MMTYDRCIIFSGPRMQPPPAGEKEAILTHKEGLGDSDSTGKPSHENGS